MLTKPINSEYFNHGYTESSYKGESTTGRSSTSFKVGLIVTGILAGSLIGFVAFLGSGYPLNVLNTVGMTVGGAGGGAVLAGFTVFCVDKYFKNQESRFNLSSSEIDFNSEDDSESSAYVDSESDSGIDPEGDKGTVFNSKKSKAVHSVFDYTDDLTADVVEEGSRSNPIVENVSSASDTEDSELEARLEHKSRYWDHYPGSDDNIFEDWPEYYTFEPPTRRSQSEIFYNFGDEF